jgi:hypothetical protein
LNPKLPYSSLRTANWEEKRKKIGRINVKGEKKVAFLVRKIKVRKKKEKRNKNKIQ